MSFVPVGFWQRFIARMLISLAEMDLQVVVVSPGVGGVPAAVPSGERPLLEGFDEKGFSCSELLAWAQEASSAQASSR